MGQVTTPDAGLIYTGLIPIPQWITSGPTAESVDLSSFNPETHVLYYADHVAHAVVAIDTDTNSVLGWVPVPNCTASSCPSGVLVVPDLQKLVVTDRGTHVYIYNLDLPGANPAAVTVPTAIDELDYDPVHQRVYLGNATAPFFLTGIDLTGPNANTVVASTVGATDPTVHDHLAEVYYKQGRLREAVSAWESALDQLNAISYVPVAKDQADAIQKKVNRAQAKLASSC